MAYPSYLRSIPTPRKVTLTHPRADQISILETLHDTSTCEIAFFHNGDWVTDELDEFAQYSEGRVHETLVYNGVPASEVEDFLTEYASA